MKKGVIANSFMIVAILAVMFLLIVVPLFSNLYGQSTDTVEPFIPVDDETLEIENMFRLTEEYVRDVKGGDTRYTYVENHIDYFFDLHSNNEEFSKYAPQMYYFRLYLLYKAEKYDEMLIVLNDFEDQYKNFVLSFSDDSRILFSSSSSFPKQYISLSQDPVVTLPVIDDERMKELSTDFPIPLSFLAVFKYIEEAKVTDSYVEVGKLVHKTDIELLFENFDSTSQSSTYNNQFYIITERLSQKDSRVYYDVLQDYYSNLLLNPPDEMINTDLDRTIIIGDLKKIHSKYIKETPFAANDYFRIQFETLIGLYILSLVEEYPAYTTLSSDSMESSFQQDASFFLSLVNNIQSYSVSDSSYEASYNRYISLLVFSYYFVENSEQAVFSFPDTETIDCISESGRTTHESVYGCQRKFIYLYYKLFSPQVPDYFNHFSLRNVISKSVALLEKDSLLVYDFEERKTKEITKETYDSFLSSYVSIVAIDYLNSGLSACTYYYGGNPFSYNGVPSWCPFFTFGYFSQSSSPYTYFSQYSELKEISKNRRFISFSPPNSYFLFSDAPFISKITRDYYKNCPKGEHRQKSASDSEENTLSIIKVEEAIKKRDLDIYCSSPDKVSSLLDFLYAQSLYYAYKEEVSEQTDLSSLNKNYCEYGNFIPALTDESIYKEHYLQICNGAS